MIRGNVGSQSKQAKRSKHGKKAKKIWKIRENNAETSKVDTAWNTAFPLLTLH